MLPKRLQAGWREEGSDKCQHWCVTKNSGGSVGEVSEVTVSNTGSWSGKLMSRGGDCLNMS